MVRVAASTAVAGMEKRKALRQFGPGSGGS